jgi:hypothetical protein
MEIHVVGNGRVDLGVGAKDVLIFNQPVEGVVMELAGGREDTADCYGRSLAGNYGDVGARDYADLREV